MNDINNQAEISDAVSAQFTDLFFISKCPVGRLLDKRSRDGNEMVGPWRDKRTNDGETSRDLRELTIDMVNRHIDGTLLDGHYARLLTYTISRDHKTNITAIDIDVKGERHGDGKNVHATFEVGKAAAIAIGQVVRDCGFIPHFEITRSGGLRVWVFHHVISAEYARAFGLLLVKRAGLPASTEVFPKQDKCTGFGSGIFVPYYGRANAGCQVFIDIDTGEILPIEDFVAAAMQGRSAVVNIAALVDSARESSELPKKNRAPKVNDSVSGGYEGDTQLSQPGRSENAYAHMLASCEYLRGIDENMRVGMHIEYDDWIRILGLLRHFGDWGRKKAHELSAFDDRYDESEVDYKIDSLTGAPFLCANTGCGKNPQDDCGMPPNKVSPVFFAYVGSRKLLMAYDEKIATESADDSNFDGADSSESFNFRTADVNEPWSIVPNGARTGVWKTVTVKDQLDYVQVLPHTLYISERVKDIDTEQESVTLVWDRDNKANRKTVPQSLIASTRDIVKLSDDGILINSSNATNVLQFLGAFQSEHMRRIPITHSVSTCGWKKLDDKSVFMWGGKPIVADGAPVPAITFNADNRDLLEGLHQQGMLDGWHQIIPMIEDYPVVKFTLLASFVSPFLDILNINQNPTIELASQTSRGKTTALMIAASVWGYPMEGRGLIKSWNSTPVYIERYSSGMNNIPLFFDESQNARPEALQNTIYQIANGTGRGRGTKEGSVHRVAKYKSVFFSAGEAKIISTANFDGMQARVASFWGTPFGNNQGDAVRAIQRVIQLHYGHAGPAVVQAFMKNPEKYSDAMRKILDASEERLRGMAEDNVGQRMAMLFAAVEAVGMFVNKVLGLGWNIPHVISSAFVMGGREKIISQPQKALEDVISWALSNEFTFQGGRNYDDKNTHIEISGVIHGDGAISFMPDRLRKVLTDRKYDYDTTLRHWRDNGWLYLPEGAQKQQRLLRQVRVGEHRLQLPCVNTDAVRIGRMKGIDFDPNSDDGSFTVD